MENRIFRAGKFRFHSNLGENRERERESGVDDSRGMIISFLFFFFQNECTEWHSIFKREYDESIGEADWRRPTGGGIDPRGITFAPPRHGSNPQIHYHPSLHPRAPSTSLDPSNIDDYHREGWKEREEGEPPLGCRQNRRTKIFGEKFGERRADPFSFASPCLKWNTFHLFSPD